MDLLYLGSKKQVNERKGTITYWVSFATCRKVDDLGYDNGFEASADKISLEDYDRISKLKPLDHFDGAVIRDSGSYKIRLAQINK